MSISKRIKQFINYIGVETKSFESKAGLSNGFVNNIGHSLRQKSQTQIKEAFPSLNMSWVLTGEGDMLATTNEAKPLRLADPYGFDATVDRFYKLEDDSLIMQVPVIPVKAYGGYMAGFADPEYYDDVQTMPVLVNGLHKGSYVAFEVEGWSMVCYDTDELAELSVRPGWIVIGRDIPKDKWKYKLHTHTTDLWIIAHRLEGIVIKQIVKHDTETATITIHSLNPDFEDKEYSLNDIEKIFSVVQIVNKIR